jgi:hypothetical protein
MLLGLVVCAQLAYASTASAFVFWSNSNGTASFFDWMNGGSDHGLFGDPILVDGDTFVFFPEMWRAESVNGVPDSASDRMEVHLWAHPGQSFTHITIHEEGDYGILTQGAVSVSGSAFAVDTNDFRVESGALTSNPPSPINSGFGTWTADTSIALDGDPWEHLVLVFDNNLLAISGLGSISFIEKKVIGITFTPEPGSLLLLGLGCVSLMGRKRRA